MPPRRLTRWIAATVCLTGTACASLASRPELIDLKTMAPRIDVTMRYAGPDNFVGTRIEGYEANRCLLTPPAALSLAGVQRALEARGLGLRVFDCYRPQQAVDHFVEWAGDEEEQRTKRWYYPEVEKSRLFALGYIAERSGHSRGSTVDLTVTRDGEPLDMGTPYDWFGPRSNTESSDVTASQRRNRLLLREVMTEAGFENYPKEWWHYTLASEPYPDRYFDVEVR